MSVLFSESKCECAGEKKASKRTMMVFGLIALLTLFRSTFLVTASTGILCSLILKYEAALSNAACADTGMILISHDMSIAI